MLRLVNRLTRTTLSASPRYTAANALSPVVSRRYPVRWFSAVPPPAEAHAAPAPTEQLNPAEDAPPPPIELSETMRDTAKYPMVPEFLPMRDVFYADKSLDYFHLDEHRQSIAAAYELWQAGKLQEAETALNNADEKDPSVILALAAIFKQQNRLDEAKQVRAVSVCA
jgi:hypothetical protein